MTNSSASDVALFFALDADWKAFSAEAKPLGQPVKLGERTVYRVEVGGHRVYAVKMGSGAVETALSAASLLTHFHCDLAFSVGPVGALDDTLPTGSWHEVGQVIPYQHGTRNPTGFQAAAFASGPEAARQPRRDGLQIPAPLTGTDQVTVASGELFVASSSYRAQLKAATGAQAVDMNLFGLETVCADQHVPLFSWRVISDRADDEASETFRAFLAHYDGVGGRALAAVVAHLPADPNAAQSYPELQRLLAQPTPASAPPHSP